MNALLHVKPEHDISAYRGPDSGAVILNIGAYNDPEHLQLYFPDHRAALDTLDALTAALAAVLP